MIQYYVVKDRARDYSVRFGLNGEIAETFTTRRAALAWMRNYYASEIAPPAPPCEESKS